MDSPVTQGRTVSQNSAEVEMPVSCNVEKWEDAAAATVNTETEKDGQIKSSMDDRMRNLIASTMSAFRSD